MCIFYSVKVCMEKLRCIRFFPTNTKQCIVGFNPGISDTARAGANHPEHPDQGERGHGVKGP